VLTTSRPDPDAARNVGGRKEAPELGSRAHDAGIATSAWHIRFHDHESNHDYCLTIVVATFTGDPTSPGDDSRGGLVGIGADFERAAFDRGEAAISSAKRTGTYEKPIAAAAATTG